jgi:hypothetical protein
LPSNTPLSENSTRTSGALCTNSAGIFSCAE